MVEARAGAVQFDREEEVYASFSENINQINW
jgi:hypothetical protein